MNTLVLVDGPNLYNDLDRWLRTRPSLDEGKRREYLLNWFDIDRVIQATIGPKNLGAYRQGLGFVVFHSEKAVGSGAARLSGPDIDRFWQRQGTYDDTSTLLVTVPGHQPETMSGKCPSCQTDVTVGSRSEKGVDTSMVTYLYEASERWDQAVLFTNDADFVPPILALRRRGKRVFSAAIDNPSTGALKRASQTFFPIPSRFLEHDLALFLLLQPGGKLDQVLRSFKERFDAKPDEFWVSVDGDACPVIFLHATDPDRENFLGSAIGDESKITWFTSNHGREGRLLYNSGFQLGMPLIRHRDLFENATWVNHWRDR